MILKRFYDEKLAQASYLIGCAACGEALVVDPNRDVEQYLDAAEREDLRITHVTETHIHADFVSGSRELATRTGATLHLSAEGDAEWQYRFADSDGAALLRDGDRFRIGNVVIETVHTPGHTPEHLSFLVTDGATADQPLALLTGDFVFVGDVGRPDLLERAVHIDGTMEAGARTLFHALQKFRELPDYLQILPGHGAGSACGKGISAVPASTVGYERMFNWALAVRDEAAFVHTVLSGQPEPPRYFAEMKRVNREGPAALGGFRRPPRLAGSRLPELVERGVLVVDTRGAAAYARGHVPGTINIPLARSFPTWAGSVLPYDRELYLLVDDATGEVVDEVSRDLAKIGIERVSGYFGAGALESWQADGRALGSIPQLTAAELGSALATGAVEVVDVRGQAEWEAGHLTGARNIPYGNLNDHLLELPRDRPLVVHCRSGARSAIAASLLRAGGIDNVLNLAGGIDAWEAGGYPVVQGEAAT